ncbi:MAG TPA: hypothetical protein PKD56_10570, partial [Chitinophagales bacterium]|nr:hypothetical protein [Chitinophagales bacterium]
MKKNTTTASYCNIALLLRCLFIAGWFAGITGFAQKFEDFRAFTEGQQDVTCVQYTLDGKRFAS